MTDAERLAPEAPRIQQTLRLPESRLESLRGWAVEGTGLAVGARLRDPDDRIALIRNSWTDGWFLPGGGVEPGEVPRRAVEREVREETRLSATVGRPLVVVEQSYVVEAGGSEADGAEASGGEWFSSQFVVYAATARDEIPDADSLGTTPDEILAARWFDRLPETLHDGDLLRPYL
jgi:ADP-ribose pyrophosphatase YjhB (NUDIX family)